MMHIFSDKKRDNYIPENRFSVIPLLPFILGTFGGKCGADFSHKGHIDYHSSRQKGMENTVI